MKKRKRKEVQDFLGLVFDTACDAGELYRHVEETKDCKQMSGKIKDAKLAGEGLTKKILKFGSGSSASGTVVYSKVVFAVLQRSMATGLLQSVLFG